MSLSKLSVNDKFNNLVEKANKIFNNKFQYSSDKFINGKTIIEITCPSHGIFTMTMINHNLCKHGGCKKCIDEFTASIVKKELTVSQEYRNKHGEKFIKLCEDKFPIFDYSKVKYVDTATKVEIICSIHGSFMVTPAGFKTSLYGCSKCADIAGATSKLPRLLKDTSPHLRAEYNDKEDFDTIWSNTSTKYLWKCTECKYEWSQSAIQRSRCKSKCRNCEGLVINDKNNIHTLYPELMLEWDPSNELDPKRLSKSSNKKVMWICKEGHKFTTSVYQRTTNNYNCQECKTINALAENSLSVKYPELAAEWHPTKNGVHTPQNVTLGMRLRAAWICKEGHEWTAFVYSRTKCQTKCQMCAANKLLETNNITILAPQILDSWDYDKNKVITPYDVTPGAATVVFWKCKDGHSWEESVHARIKTGDAVCPECPITYTIYSKSSIEWLESIIKKDKIHIQHGKNGGEFRIPETRYSADGYCKETNTIYEFHGCLWHFHNCLTNHEMCRNYLKRTPEEIAEHDLKKSNRIKELGYNLVTIYECEYKKSKAKKGRGKKPAVAINEEVLA